MGYFAIILGFVILVILCMLNINITLASFAAALAVTVVGGLPFTESMVTVFFTRFGTITGSLFPMFLFGAILAKLYTYSGAAHGYSCAYAITIDLATGNTVVPSESVDIVSSLGVLRALLS